MIFPNLAFQAMSFYVHNHSIYYHRFCSLSTDISKISNFFANFFILHKTRFLSTFLFERKVPKKDSHTFLFEQKSIKRIANVPFDRMARHRVSVQSAPRTPLHEQVRVISRWRHRESARTHADGYGTKRIHFGYS